MWHSAISFPSDTDFAIKVVQRPNGRAPTPPEQVEDDENTTEEYREFMAFPNNTAKINYLGQLLSRRGSEHALLFDQFAIMKSFRDETEGKLLTSQNTLGNRLASAAEEQTRRWTGMAEQMSGLLRHLERMDARILELEEQLRAARQSHATSQGSGGSAAASGSAAAAISEGNAALAASQALMARIQQIEYVVYRRNPSTSPGTSSQVSSREGHQLPLLPDESANDPSPMLDTSPATPSPPSPIRPPDIPSPPSPTHPPGIPLECMPPGLTGTTLPTQITGHLIAPTTVSVPAPLAVVSTTIVADSIPMTVAVPAAAAASAVESRDNSSGAPSPSEVTQGDVNQLSGATNEG